MDFTVGQCLAIKKAKIELLYPWRGSDFVYKMSREERDSKIMLWFWTSEISRFCLVIITSLFTAQPLSMTWS